MIRTLRAFFLARALREKILLAALAAVVAALWLVNLTGRAVRFRTEQQRTSAALVQQSRWLADKPKVEGAARQAASHLDPAQTLDTPRLLAMVNTLAHDSGLHTAIGEPQDTSSADGQFKVHTLQFNVTKADWSALKNFYLALQKHAPYIGIEQFAVQADRANPALLNATMKVSSVEIAHGG